MHLPFFCFFLYLHFSVFDFLFLPHSSLLVIFETRIYFSQRSFLKSYMSIWNDLTSNLKVESTKLWHFIVNINQRINFPTFFLFYLIIVVSMTRLLNVIRLFQRKGENTWEIFGKWIRISIVQTENISSSSDSLTSISLL